MQKIKAAMPDVMLMTDGDSSAQAAGRDAVAAGTKPNPYEGIYSLVGNDDQTTFESEGVQKCVKIYEDATGQEGRRAEGSQAR